MKFTVADGEGEASDTTVYVSEGSDDAQTAKGVALSGPHACLPRSSVVLQSGQVLLQFEYMQRQKVEYTPNSVWFETANVTLIGRVNDKHCVTLCISLW